ncbi:YD repeat protein [Streptomyces sp. 150FB]|nr:YD repeat protein [Streptomyces sp. 150FB]
MLNRARQRAVLVSTAAAGLVFAAVPSAVAASGTPTTPTDLFNANHACSTQVGTPTYVGAREGVVVEGVPGYTDSTGNPSLTAQYRVWPVADPTQATILSRQHAAPRFEAPVTVPADILADGQSYAWQAQTVAGSDASDWSVPCYFTVDNTAPSAAPKVTSANYPQDEWAEPGEPVHFIFDANGVDDVAGFEFTWLRDLPVIGVPIGDYGIPQPADPYDDAKFFVRADELGGSAELNLVPPAGFGSKTLDVVSLDRSYRQSARSTYNFFLNSAEPTVTPRSKPQFDQPATFLLAPDAGLQAKSPIVSYSVQTFGGQSDRTIQVKASSDGTAELRLRLDGASGESLAVSSTSANGWVSDEARWGTAFDTTPIVGSDVYAENASSGGVGLPGTFTFAPKVEGVVSYTYSFNWADPVTVQADSDHTARINWAPTESGYTDLQVNATTESGAVLASYDYSFTVN